MSAIIGDGKASHLGDGDQGQLDAQDSDTTSDNDQGVNDLEQTSSRQDPTREPPSEQPEDSTPDVPPVYSIYSPWQKRLIVLAGSIAMFFSPLTAQIYLPALNTLAEDFNVTASQINLTVTTYMIFQGITPMFIGGFADTAGRRPAYIICFVIYIAANIGLAVSKNYVSLLVVRCLQSAGSSTTVALCQAVVADIVTSAERGQYIAITVIPVVIAPSLGPVIGGALTQYLGWRSIFWFLTICAAVVFVSMLLFFPETCRSIVGDGSLRPHPMYKTFWQMISDWGAKRDARKGAGSDRDLARTTSSTTQGSRTSITRPKFRLAPPNLLGSIQLLFTKELGLLLAYSGLLFAGFYAIVTAIPSQFAAIYGFDELKIGLVYLPMAGGSIVAALVGGPSLNWNYRRHARRLGMPVDVTRQMDLSAYPIERARLEVAVPLVVLSSAAMLAWGWALHARPSVAVPCVLLFVEGVGLIGVANATNALIVDIYPRKAGAAVAANNLTRCLLGALFSAVISPMIGAMGPGWAYTIVAALYIVFLPVMFLIMAKGIQWRREIRERDDQETAEREEKERRKRGEVIDANEGAEKNLEPKAEGEQSTQGDFRKEENP